MQSLAHTVSRADLAFYISKLFTQMPFQTFAIQETELYGEVLRTA